MTTLTAATPSRGGALGPGQVARPGTAPQAGLTGADVVRIFRQRLVLVLLLWGLFSAMTAGFTWFMATFHPTYRATAFVRVRSTLPANPMTQLDQPEIRQKEMELQVQSEAIFVTSPEVLLDALKTRDVTETEWHTWARQQKDEDMIDLLADILFATPIRDSNFLRVGAEWRERAEVHTLVNAVVDTYLVKRNALQKKTLQGTRDRLDEEFREKQKELEAKRKDIEAHRGQADVWSAFEGGPSEEILTLQALLTEIRAVMDGRRSQLDNLRNASPDDLPITPELQAILQRDPMLSQLEMAWQQAEANLLLAGSRYGKNHPVVKNARIARDAALQRADSDRQQKIHSLQNQLIRQAQQNYIEAADAVGNLGERLIEAIGEQRDRDKRYSHYTKLTEDRELLRLQLEEILNQRNMLDYTLNLPSTVQIDVPSRAIPPKRRASPRWIIWMPAGLVLGLAASLGIALLIELADKSVRTPRDVPRVPVLGTIPTADDDEVEIERVETASIDVPHSIVAEAFRNLRANLFFSAPAEQQGVILVTSPSGGNGKTTVASNLAISVALSGRRVLLIDANFRRASLPRVFPGMREEGLSNILIGQGRLAELSTATSVPGLDVLSSGPVPPNPAELLGGSYLRDLVADARTLYDQVIFDSPPVLLVSDAMVLAGAVDGVLVVCQYRATSRGAFQRTQAQLEAISARIFGAVLNMVQTRAGGYFRKAYREFYDYQEPEEPGHAPGRLQLDAVAGVGGAPAVAATITPPAGPGGGADAQESEETPSIESPEPRAATEIDDLEDFEIGVPPDLDVLGPTEDEAAAGEVSPPEEQGPIIEPPDLSDEISKIDGDQAFGDDLDLDTDFPIDERFDLDDDLGESDRPDQPRPGP